MKNQDLREMTEDQLFEAHCDSTHELADLSRGVFALKKQAAMHAKRLDKIELELESREAKTLRLADKLN